MGQKVNPHGFRVGVIKDWDSRWFTGKKEFGDTLVEDHKIRTVLKSSCTLRCPQDRDRARRPEGPGQHPLRKARHGHRPRRQRDRQAPRSDREDDRQAGRRQHRRGSHPRPERTAGRGERRFPAGAPHRLPACDEAVHQPHHAHGCQGHQDLGRRPSGRRRYRPHRALSRGHHPPAGPCVPTSITASPRRTPPTARSASRSGSTRARCSRAQNLVKKEGSK